MRGGARKGTGPKSPHGKVERIYVPGQLASIIREKGTGWVLETLVRELQAEPTWKPVRAIGDVCKVEKAKGETK